MKIPNLRHSRDSSQNKGLSKYQRRASWLQTIPSLLETGWQAGAARAKQGQYWAQVGILYQTASRHPVANQYFLGFWMVGICREGHSQRSAPKKRCMAHLRQACPLPPRKPSGWDRGGDKIHSPSGETTTSTWSPELLGPGKGTKHRPNRVHAFVEYLRTLPGQLRPGKCTQPRACFRQCTSRSNIDPEKYKLGKCTHPELGQTQCS